MQWQTKKCCRLYDLQIIAAAAPKCDYMEIMILAGRITYIFIIQFPWNNENIRFCAIDYPAVCKSSVFSCIRTYWCIYQRGRTTFVEEGLIVCSSIVFLKNLIIYVNVSLIIDNSIGLALVYFWNYVKKIFFDILWWLTSFFRRSFLGTVFTISGEILEKSNLIFQDIINFCF